MVEGREGLRLAGLLDGVRAMANRVYAGESWWVEGDRAQIECLYRKESRARPTCFVVAVAEGGQEGERARKRTAPREWGGDTGARRTTARTGGEEEGGASGAPLRAALEGDDTQAAESAAQEELPGAEAQQEAATADDDEERRGDGGGGWREAAAAAAAAAVRRVASGVGSMWSMARGIGARGKRALWERAGGKRARGEEDTDGEAEKRRRTGDG